MYNSKSKLVHSNHEGLVRIVKIQLNDYVSLQTLLKTDNG